MSTEPQQTRSHESMDRMLDAGEELFLSSGPNGLKLNLIIEKSGGSTGSFYARFGDMNGYLEALHKRALEQIEAELAPIFKKAAGQNSLHETLSLFLKELIKVLRKFKAPIFFFAVGRTHVPTSREKGADFTLGFRRHFLEMLKPFVQNSALPETKRRLDMVFRMVVATSFQFVMFEQNEVSPLKMSDRDIANEWAALLGAGLESSISK